MNNKKELEATLNHIACCLDDDKQQARYDLDDYSDNAAELVEELEKLYSVKQNGTELYISKK